VLVHFVFSLTVVFFFIDDPTPLRSHSTDAVDINVSPDKRTLFLHSEDKLVVELKVRISCFV
jgi:hypothetical protein